MKKRFSLKDHLFNKETVAYLAQLFAEADSSFNKKRFEADVMKNLLKLELKERIVWIAEVLGKHLPEDFKKASSLIIKALPPKLDPAKTDDDFGSFILAPLGEYVVRNGLHKEYIETSLETLFELTQRFSMEDAMRPFINNFQKEVLGKYKKWVKHSNYHVRRLVSESTRPLLPWSRRITLRVDEPVEFLTALHTDKTRYVTRSVANHLNDIAKKNSKLAVDTLTLWKEMGEQDIKELEWMTRHALRTLIKDGNTDALELIGYGKAPKVKVEHFTVENPKLAKGDTLSFSFELYGVQSEELLIDYVIDFVKAKGERKPKVFKIKKIAVKKGETTKIVKRHRLLADATTFKLHQGIHALTLQINGKKLNSAEFVIR